MRPGGGRRASRAAGIIHFDSDNKATNKNWEILHNLIPNKDGRPIRPIRDPPADVDEMIREYEEWAETEWWIVIIASITALLMLVFFLTL